MVGNNVFDIYAAPSATCAADTDNPTGFTLIGDNVVGPIDFVSSQGFVPTAIAPTDLLGVCEPPSTTFKNGRIRYYRGSIACSTSSHCYLNEKGRKEAQARCGGTHRTC
jgi:hypothetical protein